jgi:periplasmic copper chaperone A
MSTTLKRAMAVVVPAGAALAMVAAPAGAHVTVSSPDAVPGGYGKLVFRVPNETDDAATVKLQVTLPTDTPFASVSTKPHPGWDVRVRDVKLPDPVKVGDLTLTDAARTVTWTAQPGNGLEPGEFDEFELSVGPIADDATELVFPAIQTYDDGEVVRWTQPTPDNGAEPEHPAPVLDLTGADTHAEGADAAMQVASAESDDTDGPGADATDATARTLAVGGLAVGVVALGSSFIHRRRREEGDRVR